jgi:hypothetical protein
MQDLTMSRARYFYLGGCAFISGVLFTRLYYHHYAPNWDTLVTFLIIIAIWLPFGYWQYRRRSSG